MERNKTFIVHDLNDLRNPVLELMGFVMHHLQEKGLAVFLNGELGSGKTAFVQEFARAVGVEERVQSPTFTLMKSYDVETDLIPDLKKIVHIDAYRLDPIHRQTLRVDELIDEPGVMVFVEWPTEIELDLSLASVFLDFSVIDEETRRILMRPKNHEI